MAQRILGDDDEITLGMRMDYAYALYMGDGPVEAGSTVGTREADLREAVETLEDVERIARRVLGGAHPRSRNIAEHLQEARLRLKWYRDSIAEVLGLLFPRKK